MSFPKHIRSSAPSVSILLKTDKTLASRYVIGHNFLANAGHLLSQCKQNQQERNKQAQNKPGEKILLVQQEGVPCSYADILTASLEKAAYKVHRFTVPAGEECKSEQWLIRLWQHMQELELNRSATLFTIGGGSALDLGGFAASTYMRGINFVSVPTTLLAQIDAAIGGKTGINLGTAKNLVGSFHLPILTLVDCKLLETLPQRELNSGMAEIIKYALLEKTLSQETEYKPGYKDFLTVIKENFPQGITATDPALQPIILNCIRMKLAVVAKDPYEAGLRRCLNLGHTIGHAVEKVSRFALSHGEAVSIGLVYAMSLACSLNKLPPAKFEEAKSLLEKFALPTALPPSIPADDILAALSCDKKNTDNDTIHFVLPVSSLGYVDYSHRLSRQSIKLIFN